MTVELDGVGKTYSGGVRAVDGLNLTVEDGEFLVLVGPSGCGKSTALRMIAGLEVVSDGEIHIGGRVVNDVPPQQRNVAMVFQNYALYPHMTVRRNLEFPLKMQQLSRAEIRRRVVDTAALLGLAELLERRPKALSGGQRQRVAMGRALVRDADVLLLDEPLSNLDPALRVQIRSDIAALQARLGVTTIYVTHDQVEAMTLGHRVAVMRDGRLQQVATPRELYERPANAFVARFIGQPGMNVLQVPLRTAGDALAIGLGDAGLAVAPEQAEVLRPHAGGDVLVGIRPQALVLAEDAGQATLTATVQAVEFLGHETVLHLAANVVVTGHQPGALPPSPALVAVQPGQPGVHRGDSVCLCVDPAALHFFAPDGESII